MKDKYDWRNFPTPFDMSFRPTGSPAADIDYAKGTLEDGYELAVGGKEVPLPDDIRRKLEEQVLMWELTS